MFRSLYNHVIRLAATRRATPVLAATAFAEASFFPLPPDAILAPMVVARPERAWRYAAVCSLASVLGGLSGTAIGVFLQPVGVAVLHAGVVLDRHLRLLAILGGALVVGVLALTLLH